MKNPNSHEFEYRAINPRMIKFDESYQRPLDMHRVERIVKEWDGNLFNEPKVSLRDGAFYCFNGQHSVVAWRKKFGDKPVMCKVFKGMTWLDECEAFIQQQGISKDPTTAEKLGAAFNAKRPDVVDMVNGAMLAGYKVSFKSSKAADTIIAIAALYRAYTTLGKQMYTEMLSAMHEAWPGNRDAVDAGIIGAMVLFYQVYGGKFNSDDLAKSLRRIAPMEIKTGALANTTKERARVILRKYNWKRTNRKLEDVL